MKGWMIFVEGGDSPRVVHVSKNIALREAERLAKKSPEKEVMLLQMVKRLKSADGNAVESLGSHIPADYHLTPENMVRRDSPNRLMPKRETLKLAKQ